MKPISWLGIGLSFMAVGCYESSGTSGSHSDADLTVSDGGVHVCEPGASRPCRCDDGGEGSQTCRGDGSGWTSCGCAVPDGGVDWARRDVRPCNETYSEPCRRVESNDAGAGDSSAGDVGPCDAYPPGVSPVVVTSDCSDISRHDEPFDGGTALRIIGIYETDAPHHEMGDCRVELDLDHDVVLVLSSYEPARWIVTNTGTGVIERIIVSSAYENEVVADAGIPVEMTWRETGGGYWGTAFHWWDEERRDVVERAEAMTGRELTSFHGCYHSSGFTMSEGCDGPVPPSDLDCDAQGELHEGPDLDVLGDCCACVRNETVYCLTLTWDAAVAIVGLDSGTVCPLLAPVGIDAGPVAFSMTWLDQYLYACSGPRNRLARVDLGDGTVEHVDVWCEAVAAWDDGLLVEPTWRAGDYFGQMWFYPSFLDAECADAEVLGVEYNESRITVNGDVLYSAGRSPDRIETLDLPSGRLLEPIELEGYDGIIDGISVIDRELLVVRSGASEGRIAVFDVEDGSFLWDVPVEEPIGGLFCLSNP